MNLLDYSKDVTSQFGEDGIIEKIFEVLNIEKGTCVEFGAWDGQHFSNTYNLIVNKGWTGVMIEGGDYRFAKLLETHGENPNVYCQHTIVGFEDNSLDDCVSKTPLPYDYDLLSIDVDGVDYHILASIKKYKPKVIVIEFNPAIQNQISFIQPKDMSINQGSSLKATIELAYTMGYELVCCTDGGNAIFVDNEYYSLFKISDNSIDKMFKDISLQTFVFQLYDGTLIHEGQNKLIWAGGIGSAIVIPQPATQKFNGMM